MDTQALSIEITVHGVAPSNEPLGESAELLLRADGFHDPQGLGGSGEQRALSAIEAAELLAASFDRYELATLLRHFEALRAALEQTSTAA
ncbi:MAG TPA: hypothetical protein VGX91_13850 [Candidatus Cybelea sp.]|jgi:hypothetical protein|nr:hypothetical protein [Candidatus Cybelea sp.]